MPREWIPLRHGSRFIVKIIRSADGTLDFPSSAPPERLRRYDDAPVSADLDQRSSERGFDRPAILERGAQPIEDQGFEALETEGRRRLPQDGSERPRDNPQLNSVRLAEERRSVEFDRCWTLADQSRCKHRGSPGLEGLLHPPEAPRKRCPTLGGESLRFQERQEPAKACAREPRIGVRGVLDVGPAFRSAGRDQARLAKRKERTGKRNAFPGDLGPHAGEAGRARAAGEPHEDRFSLVVERMSAQEVRGTNLPGEGCEEALACLARPLLQTRLRLRSTPAQDSVRQAASSGPGRNGRGFLGGFGPQAVVDGGNGHGGSCALSTHASCKADEDDGIRPSRHGENHRGRPGLRGVEIGLEERRDV